MEVFMTCIKKLKIFRYYDIIKHTVFSYDIDHVTSTYMYFRSEKLLSNELRNGQSKKVVVLKNDNARMWKNVYLTRRKFEP